ncbi:MAG TPA: TraM recognition domain-containing protein [Acidimicrobiales bacterium]|nr:TraM recognition domain-containing protein [Acidimicrobiales bacterium]
MNTSVARSSIYRDVSKYNDSANRRMTALAPGEMLLGAALVVLAVTLGAADVVGAFLSHTRLISFGATATFLMRVFGYPGAASTAWPIHARHFATFAFWSLTATCLIPPTMLVVFIARRRVHHDMKGFATRQELECVATLEAARRQAKVTRPLTATTDASPGSFGYCLGVTVAPRGVPLFASFEHSLQLVAPPGAGKTLRVLAPILRHHPGPVLATSTKPDLYETSVTAREGFGPVFTLDPDGLCPAAMPLRWSPVSGCIDSRVAERRASALVAASGDSADVRGGGFFRRSAVAVLASYLHAAALSGSSMRDVCNWATRPHDPAPLRILSAQAEGSIDWSAKLHSHTTGAAETTSGVMRTVDLALSCFADPHVLAQTTPRDGEKFVFDEFFARNGTVYALGKDRGALGGSGPLITAFADELILAGELRAASMPGRRLDPPLLACLDEAPSIAPLPGLPALVADGRGRGIIVMIAMQSFSQADARWGREGSRTIRNASSILMVFGGLSVASDLEELSKLCGEKSIERVSLTENGNGTSSQSRHFAEEPVLSPSAIHALGEGTALIFFGRLPPVLAYLPGLWEREDAEEAIAEEIAAKVANDIARNLTSPDIDARITSQPTLDYKEQIR